MGYISMVRPSWRKTPIDIDINHVASETMLCRVSKNEEYQVPGPPHKSCRIPQLGSHDDSLRLRFLVTARPEDSELDKSPTFRDAANIEFGMRCE